MNAWTNFKEFESDYEGDELYRYRRLMPKWAFDDEDDDIEAWYGD